MDWFKGKIETGKPHDIKWEDLWFPVTIFQEIHPKSGDFLGGIGARGAPRDGYPNPIPRKMQ